MKLNSKAAPKAGAALLLAGYQTATQPQLIFTLLLLLFAIISSKAI
jgi:hypothetical protein